MTSSTSRPVLLGVDGRSGSGKTSLATTLTSGLRADHGLDVELFHVEDVYRGWSGLEAGIDHYVSHVLEPLRHGEPASWFAWDWVHDAVESVPRTTRPAAVVICEGVGSAAPKARPLLDAALRLVAPPHLRKERALARDGETYRPYWDLWAGQEEELMGTQRCSHPGQHSHGPFDLTLSMTAATEAADLERKALSWALNAINAAA
jgi:anthranilate synthase component 1/para-aminobenzoate synthetase